MSAVPSPADAYAHPVAWAMRAGGTAPVEGAEAEYLGVAAGTELPCWRPARHHWLLGELALELFAGRSRRLIVTCPPRHGKSSFLSRFFAGWWLGRRPRERVIVVSYSEALSREFSGLCRDDLAEHGQEVFGVCAVSRASATEWRPIVEGKPTEGRYLATSVGGTCAGKGASLVIVDDLFKGAAECRSAALRNHASTFFFSEVLTRLAPGGVVIMVGTRWHEDDVIGRLLAGAGDERAHALPWELVSLPAFAGEGDRLGRVAGEALWPERYPERELLGIKAELDLGDPNAWSALYQCEPVPAGGAFFRRDWLHYYSPRELPPTLRRFGVLDLAGSAKSYADYTVLLACGWCPATRRLYVLDCVRGRFDGSELLPLLRREHARWELELILVEQVASGLPAVVVSDLPLRGVKPEKDKVSRALPVTAAMAAGRVLLPSGAGWLAEFERELLAFPEGKHDDQVDCLSYAVAACGHGGGVAPPQAEGGYGERKGNGWKIGR